MKDPYRTSLALGAPPKTPPPNNWRSPFRAFFCDHPDLGPSSTVEFSLLKEYLFTESSVIEHPHALELGGRRYIPGGAIRYTLYLEGSGFCEVCKCWVTLLGSLSNVGGIDASITEFKRWLASPTTLATSVGWRTARTDVWWPSALKLPAKPLSVLVLRSRNRYGAQVETALPLDERYPLPFESP